MTQQYQVVPGGTTTVYLGDSSQMYGNVGLQNVAGGNGVNQYIVNQGQGGVVHNQHLIGIAQQTSGAVQLGAYQQQQLFVMGNSLQQQGLYTFTAAQAGFGVQQPILAATQPQSSSFVSPPPAPQVFYGAQPANSSFVLNPGCVGSNWLYPAVKQETLVTSGTGELVQNGFLQQHNSVVSVVGQPSANSATQVLLLLPSGEQRLVKMEVPGADSSGQVNESVVNSGIPPEMKSEHFENMFIKREPVDQLVQVNESVVNSGIPPEMKSEHFENMFIKQEPVDQLVQTDFSETDVNPLGVDDMKMEQLVDSVVKDESEQEVALTMLSSEEAPTQHAAIDTLDISHLQDQLTGGTEDHRRKKQATQEVPKYLEVLAVCRHCGYLSMDFNRCQRCKRKLPEAVKSFEVPNKEASVDKKIQTKPPDRLSCESSVSSLYNQQVQIQTKPPDRLSCESSVSSLYNQQVQIQTKPPDRLSCESSVSSLYNQQVQDEDLKSELTIVEHAVDPGDSSQFPPAGSPAVLTLCWRCTICGLQFDTLITLALHTKIHRVNNCTKCPRKFTQTHQLSPHMLRIHMKPCSICGKSFKRSSALATHKRIHTGSRPYKCKMCSRTFAQNSTLNNHIASKHSSNRPHKCLICGKGFKLKRALVGHTRTIHSEERPYCCGICAKSFRLESSIIKHTERIHSKIGPNQCPTCGKMFATKTGLSVHIKTHLGVRPYKCDECGRRFVQKSDVTEHILRIHVGEEKQQCTECGKTVSSLRGLVLHMRTHSVDQEMFECDICSKQLTRKYDLKKHMRIHTGEKPYKCDLCGKLSRSKSNLANHMKVMHSPLFRPYECIICNKIFKQKAALANHIKTQHLEDVI